MTKVYHVEVFVPAHLKNSGFVGQLKYSDHALKAAREDKYAKLGPVNLPTMFDYRNAKLIEVEVENGRAIKRLCRVSLDDRRDLVLAILSGGIVKTVWINLKGDKHRSLNKSRYATF